MVVEGLYMEETMILMDVNFFAVVIAAVLNMVVGYAWYHPNFLGKLWCNVHDWKDEKLQPTFFHFAAAFINGFIIAWVFGAILYYFGVVGIWDCIVMGFWFWLGFIATTQFSGVIWAKKPLVAYFIDAGFFLLALLIMGVVFGVLT